ncbi:hypothetical protein HJ590_02100 [Naumannella sp. ID2617S]|nr:hypothetical protein [Naumannella sp. ID2617S]
MSHVTPIRSAQSALPGQPLPTPPSRPRNHGQPYTDEDHEQLVKLAREGRDADAIAEALGRTRPVVLQRMRRLLPLDHRGCPTDRILSALRAAIAEPDYDWRTTVLLTPPPPPPAPVQEVLRTGLAGLDPDQLVRVTHAVAVSATPGSQDLLDELAREVARQHLEHRLVALHQRHLRRTNRGDLATDRDTAEAWAAELLRGGDEPPAYAWYRPEPSSQSRSGRWE